MKKSLATYKVIEKYFYNNEELKNASVDNIIEFLQMKIEEQDEDLINLLIESALDLDMICEAVQVVESCLMCDKPFNEFEQTHGKKYCSARCQNVDSDIDFLRGS